MDLAFSIACLVCGTAYCRSTHKGTTVGTTRVLIGIAIQVQLFMAVYGALSLFILLLESVI